MATAPPASSAGDGTRIEVKLSDSLRIEPTAIAVRAGVPVTFVITNTGGTDHEFYLGDEAAQAAHEQEMVASGGMGHDEPAGIAVKPGQTRELTYTFAQAGQALAGCHVAGHYAAGMKASITITVAG
ncbi:MAG TPA: plastocyanin/azurin family copper-binding protein [Patescibacteria group bacterium]|nr:plastocyanin/azurin family copper-binding protein [Patescibacteria group bacterium]